MFKVRGGYSANCQKNNDIWLNIGVVNFKILNSDLEKIKSCQL